MGMMEKKLKLLKWGCIGFRFEGLYWDKEAAIV